VKTLVAIIPMTWHGIVIGFFGEPSGFFDSGKFTFKGKAVTIAVYFLVALYILIINVYDRMRIKRESDHAAITKFVLDKVLFLYDGKLDNQLDAFFSTKQPVTTFTYDIEKRINVILKELIHCVAYSSGIEARNISAAIFFTFNKKKGHWDLLEKNYSDAFDGKIRDAIMQDDSFAYFLKNVSGDFYYLNDKYKDGICHEKEGRVVPIYRLNGMDIQTQKETGKYGSIVGWKFKIKRKKTTYIQAMLFISTYGSKLDNSLTGRYKKTVQHNLRELILPYFQMNLQAELMHLYRGD
jgi:hypothetical protein